MIKAEKYLTICICIAVCFQRLSMAAGSIFWGLSIAIFLYLLCKNYKNEIFANSANNYSSYYKAFAVFALCILPSVLFVRYRSIGRGEAPRFIFIKSLNGFSIHSCG